MKSVGAIISRQIWPRVSASKLGERLPEYLRQVAAPKLGLAEGKIELEKIETGAVATIRRWKTKESGTLYVRIWPSDRQACPAREHETASGLFAAAGLATPKLLMTDDSFATLRRWRLEATIEAEAPGEPFDTRREDHRALLPEIAKQLAALHRSSDVRWGKPWRPENEMLDPRRFWAGRILKFRERINTTTSQLTAEELKRGLEQLKRRLDEIRISWPSLVHGDVTGAHIFVGEGGALTWIDFGAAAYWLPEEDLAHVRTRLFSGQDFARFLGIYAKHARGDRAIEPETIKTLAIFQLWERLNSRIQRRLRREVKQQQTGETKASLQLLAEEQRRIEHQLSQIIMGER